MSAISSIKENSSNGALAVDPVNPSPVSTFWLDVVDGVSSVARRIFQAFQPSLGGGYVVPGMGAGVGLMDCVGGAIGCHNSTMDLVTATEIGDEEGKRRAEAQGIQSFYVSLGGATFATQQIAQMAHAVALAASVALAGLVCVTYGVASLVGIGVGTLGIYRNMTFRSNLKTGTDEEILESLNWLKERMTISEGERAEIMKDDDLSADEKLAALEHVVQRETAHMARRTSPSIAKELAKFNLGGNKNRLILDFQEEWDKRKSGENDSQVCRKEAVELINGVKQANLENTLKKVVGVLVAIVFLIGIIMATLASAGSLPLVLLGVASTINSILLFKK